MIGVSLNNIASVSSKSERLLSFIPGTKIDVTLIETNVSKYNINIKCKL